MSLAAIAFVAAIAAIAAIAALGSAASHAVAGLGLGVLAATALSAMRWLAANPAGYQIGIELMILNATLTLGLLWATSKAGCGRQI